MSLLTTSRPCLTGKARLRFDATAQRYLLLYPEKGLELNATAADMLQLCTGEHTVTAIIERLVAKYGGDTAVVEREVLTFLGTMLARGLVAVPEDDVAVSLPATPGGRDRAPRSTGTRTSERPQLDPEAPTRAPRPYTLVAELTYRCPLRCVYCSNPLDWARHGDELDTAAWLRVLGEAQELGVVQVNLTGGEPLVRADLEPIVEGARGRELYTNLITSGIPLTRARLAGLRDLGLDSVQVSIQDVRAPESDRIAGLTSFTRKIEVAHWVKDLGLPLTINTVLHRENLERVPEVIALAEQLGADRLELANTQYLGWALLNRAALLPGRSALARARDVAAAARQRLRGRMEILFVTPDYYAEYPKACMDGWGRRFLLVSPSGLVLPCHAAHTLPGLVFDDVRTRGLGEIWRDSPAFNAFRGEAWMPEPCRSCDRRTIDFGGCRCQAYHLTGDAAATDPVCRLAPDHGLIEAARASATHGTDTPLQYRVPRIGHPRVEPDSPSDTEH